MPVFTFGEWLPDQPDYQNQGVLRATNVFPSATGYEPVPRFEPLTDALASRPLGAIRSRDANGNVFEFAGDAGKLYQRVSSEWQDRSITGGYSTGSGERWEFVRWKDKILATNFSDDPQHITFGASEFANLTTALRARHIAAVRDFVVFGNTFDTTDGNVPDRVRWSAFNDETDYTVSPATGSDFQDLKGEAVQRVLGGEFGIVFTASSVWRMTFVGTPAWFQFDEVLPGIGAISPGAVVRDGDRAYFLSPRGFYMLTNGASPQPIGANKVDNFVLSDLQVDSAFRMSATVDPESHRVLWSYPGAGSDGTPNRIVVYDPTLDRWTVIEHENELIWQSGGIGVTLEELDGFSASIDDLGVSLDSPVWKGSGRLFAAFNADRRNGQFRGTPMTAVIETREHEIHSGRRARLHAFRPVVDGGSVTARVGTRNNQAETPQYGPILNQTQTGRFATRANARYHRIELTISGHWRNAVGVQIDRQDARRGGRRG